MSEVPEIQGWYHRDSSSDAVRVRLSLVERSLSLHTLSGRLIANWSLDRLETREIAVLAERWEIGDRDVPEAHLVLESDDDYRIVRRASPRLRPIRVRFWRQLSFSAAHAGQITGWPALLILVLASAVAAFWSLF